MGEVDHHLGALQPLDRVVLVDRRDQLQVVGRLDGLAHFDTDAPAGAENSYPDHGPKAIPSALTASPGGCTIQAGGAGAPGRVRPRRGCAGAVPQEDSGKIRQVDSAPLKSLSS
ncbi:hypothetical protein Psi01_25190 [Planobispora siamensis]|uniref:Uncharacterized protein n=1 Tax=Planobispora siamensis TaxID=936338 RepID=A0A8J3SEL2_9ACTN|nr:hypothetical protein Psi01_25190 [Planobispora siamensis]